MALKNCVDSSQCEELYECHVEVVVLSVLSEVPNVRAHVLSELTWLHNGVPGCSTKVRG